MPAETGSVNGDNQQIFFAAYGTKFVYNEKQLGCSKTADMENMVKNIGAHFFYAAVVGRCKCFAPFKDRH